jgi:alkyl sulfatase BDS1-like metallo-beta-lactamase superfamily hydrolase
LWVARTEDWENETVIKEYKANSPKDATASVLKHHATVRATLPFSDTRDLDESAKGFIGTRANALVEKDGRIVWSLEQYGFLSDEEAAPTVNPSLWRQARLNMNHGLFEVVPGVYQIRGFDVANMTLIEGDTGVIVFDTLTAIESARAALELYFEHRGRRPVKAVIFSHSHTDHYGGALGVFDDDMRARGVPVIAPDQFLENAVSETVIAGPAMVRRAHYQFGPLLPKGSRGQVDTGLGKTMPAGTSAIVRPTDLIKATGDKRVIDGIEIEFQMAPNSEAPAEMHIYVPRYRMLNLAENCNHNFHNLLPFRGAEVRLPLLWSKYLNEALHLWGDKAEVMCGQHHWPVWGKERIQTMIRQQRDLYKFAHDQTVRLMNHGLTAPEISETIRLPASLENAWHTRGYYGHIRHNVKAIYQKYLGWYDCNPANLDPLPPVESGRKFVEYMGGADAILDMARKDFDNGEFRFVAQALSHLVFAQPDNKTARSLLADTFEQLGYLAESALWRNSYLFGAYELRNGSVTTQARQTLPLETARALSTDQLWDALSVRLNGPKAEGRHIVLNWIFADTKETFVMTLENAALTYIAVAPAVEAQATVTLARDALNQLVSYDKTLADVMANSQLSITGDARKLEELVALMDVFPRRFEIVEPKSTVLA